jgi:hypothetical protein
MSKSEALKLLHKLGGIAICEDLIRLGMNYPGLALRKLCIDGTIGWIDSSLSQIGGKPRIYYTYD